MLNQEQTEIIKKQLIEKVGSIFPEDKKDFAINQIESMSSEELEEFLKSNNLSIQPGTQKCIFCSIISEKLPSHTIDETASAKAVLEINPVSKGHTLIIPKKHISSSDKISKSIQTFSEKISKKLKIKLKPKRVDIVESELMGHLAINIIPVYKSEDINSERKKASEEELDSTMELISKKNIKKEKKKPQEVKEIKREELLEEEKLWLPKRIP